MDVLHIGKTTLDSSVDIVRLRAEEVWKAQLAHLILLQETDSYSAIKKTE